MEFLAAQVSHCRIDHLVKVVGQDFARETHGNAFSTLGEQQGELDGQSEGFTFASVIGESPVGHFGVVNRIQGEFAQTGFDVTTSCGTVSSQDVAPVTLGVDEQLLLSQLHQGAVDGGVTMRVVLHRQAHDIGHLVVVSVVSLFHGVHDAPLHRLEAVLDVWHGTLENDIGGIVEKPVLVHATQLQFLIFWNLVG